MNVKAKLDTHCYNLVSSVKEWLRLSLHRWLVSTYSVLEMHDDYYAWLVSLRQF